MTSARVLADSVTPEGIRLTTLEVTMHRFVLAEFNTHRVFSRNSASSRAIPLQRQISRLRDGLAYPVSWPSEQPGMQGGAEVDATHQTIAAQIWAGAAHEMITTAQRLANFGIHKSVINRLLEPFMWHTVIVTSSEWDNFFGLRCHEMAQPEIRAAAECMRNAIALNAPKMLYPGEWHVPFVEDGSWTATNETVLNLEASLKTSAACCAWVSTANHDGDHSYEAVDRMYHRLSSADPLHASPFEHQATPGDGPGNFNGWLQLRHMIEDGNPPWSPIMTIKVVHANQISVGGEVALDADFDAKPSRADREGDSQPLPTASDGPVAHELVKADLDDRLALGIGRYGQPLQPHNGRDSLQDAYEEALDLVVYLKNAIYERDNPQ